MIVACLPPERGSFRVMRRSFTPCGRLLSLLTSSFFTAKPTPASRHSLLALPLQTVNVYPAPLSLSCPSSARRVSLSTAMSMFYLPSSFPNRLLSMRVRTFHAPSVIGWILVFFFLLFAPLLWDPRQPRSAGQGEVEIGNVWDTLSSPLLML